MSFIFYNEFFKILAFFSVCMCAEHACGNQRTTVRSGLSACTVASRDGAQIAGLAWPSAFTLCAIFPSLHQSHIIGEFMIAIQIQGRSGPSIIRNTPKS